MTHSFIHIVGLICMFVRCECVCVCVSGHVCTHERGQISTCLRSWGAETEGWRDEQRRRRVEQSGWLTLTEWLLLIRALWCVYCHIHYCECLNDDFRKGWWKCFIERRLINPKYDWSQDLKRADMYWISNRMSTSARQLSGILKGAFHVAITHKVCEWKSAEETKSLIRRSGPIDI